MGIFSKIKAIFSNDKVAQEAESFDSKELQKKGWFQGVIFEINQQIENIIPGQYVIVTQSCDLLYHDLSIEPYAELVKIEAVEQKNDSVMYGKSTRELVFECINGQYWKAGSILGRQLLPKEKLLKLKPKSSVKDIRNFSSWLGRRYDRVAFPDNFNNLFPNARKCDAEKAYKKLVQFSKKYDANISEIWISLNSWEELSPGKVYDFSMIFIFHGEGDKDQIEAELEVLIEGKPNPSKKAGIVEKKGIRGCLNGINIDEYLILEAHEFTRADMDSYSLFNLDYISHSSGADVSGFR